MKKTLLASSFVAVFSLLHGCGGGGGSDSTANAETSTPALGWRLPVSEVSRDITLKNNENLIYGWGCTTQKFYNSKAEFIGGKDFYGFSLPLPLTAGNYKVTVSELYTDTNDSDGVLYFLSSGYQVEDLVFNQSYSIGKSSVKLLKFNLSSSRSMAATFSNMALALYDGQLNTLNISNGTPITLAAGTYYVLGHHSGVNTCRYDELGSFYLVDLGAAS